MKKDPLAEQVNVVFSDKDIQIKHLERWEKILAALLLIVPFCIGAWLMFPAFDWLFSWVTKKPQPSFDVLRFITGLTLCSCCSYIIERLFDPGWVTVTIRKVRDNIVLFPKKRQ